MTAPEHRLPPTTREIWMACVALGVAAGLVELLVLWSRKSARPMIKLSDDYVWSVPTAMVVVSILVALPFLMGMRWRREASATLAVFASASVAFLDLLLLVPGLAPYAAALAAAGLGAQTSRLVLRSAGLRRVLSLSVPVFTAAVLITSLAAGAGRTPLASPPPGAPGQGPNVLLITLDTVRAASLSLYGYERNTTPHLASWARRGVVFDRAFATAPWTLPSHASLFTGRWPHELSTDYDTPLDGAFPTLAEFFQGAGYATAGFVANYGYCGRSSGLARGFEVYDDFPRSMAQAVSNSTLLRSVADNFTLRRVVENDQHLNRRHASDLNARFLQWASARGRTPFFAFLNYFDAHEPYLPPAPYDRAFGPARRNGRHSPLHHALWNPASPSRELADDDLREERDAYDGAVAHLDAEVGALLDELARRGLLANTLVVITSDHGEEFAEHRVLEHGYSLYRPSVHVPLLVMMPGSVPGDRRVAAPVSLRDVAATIAGLASPGAAARFPGHTLAIHWDDAAGRPGDGSPVLSELSRPSGHHPDWYPSSRGDMQSIVVGDRRYIRNGDGSEELYDLVADPWERVNLAARPDAADALATARRALGSLRTRGPG